VETVSVKVLEKYGADLTGLRNAVIELVAQEKANKQPGDRRIHSEGLAPQNYSGSIRHSDENGWLPPAPHARGNLASTPIGRWLTR
jgi:hypothetical protein